MNLTAQEYWEWRHAIECMNHAETRKNLKGLESNYKLKEIEIMQLRHSLFKQTFQVAEQESAIAKQDYEAIKKRIEDRLGISLNGCVIDDGDYAVRNLDQSSKE